jgi:hypothetical protein
MEHEPSPRHDLDGRPDRIADEQHVGLMTCAGEGPGQLGDMHAQPAGERVAVGSFERDPE